jgi:hypothetical protein
VFGPAPAGIRGDRCCVGLRAGLVIAAGGAVVGRPRQYDRADPCHILSLLGLPASRTDPMSALCVSQLSHGSTAARAKRALVRHGRALTNLRPPAMLPF